MLYPVILCGGSGTRLWPLSRRHYPKQFLAVNGENTMLQAAAERAGGLRESG
ncbi:MAG: sugar phosphate nucleotidyltransferase, partial [Ectothiorhodospiraceae bacterium]